MRWHLRFDGGTARVVSGVMSGRRVLKVVRHDGVEDEGLHQVTVAWTTRMTINDKNFHQNYICTKNIIAACDWI